MIKLGKDSKVMLKGQLFDAETIKDLLGNLGVEVRLCDRKQTDRVIPVQLQRGTVDLDQVKDSIERVNEDVRVTVL